MDRRGFIGALVGAASATAPLVDPERLLWVPGRKLISIPNVPSVMYYTLTVTMKVPKVIGTPNTDSGPLVFDWDIEQIKLPIAGSPTKENVQDHCDCANAIYNAVVGGRVQFDWSVSGEKPQVGEHLWLALPRQDGVARHGVIEAAGDVRAPMVTYGSLCNRVMEKVRPLRGWLPEQG